MVDFEDFGGGLSFDFAHFNWNNCSDKIFCVPQGIYCKAILKIQRGLQEFFAIQTILEDSGRYN